MFLCNYLRRRALHKSLSKVPTAIIPITDVRSATVLLDAADPSFEECERNVRAYFRSRSVPVKVIYTCLSKLGKDAPVPADRASALFLKDLGWFGRPSSQKISSLAGAQTDLFISLCTEKNYPAEYISHCIPARFKLGRFPLSVYDIVLDGREGQSQTEVFRSIEELFTKIK
jgi:hypothetical protein